VLSRTDRSPRAGGARLPSPPPRALAGRLAVLGAALLFSTGGAAIKSCALDAWSLASFRSGVAALFLLALVRPRRRLLDPRVWVVGAAYAATMLLYVAANKSATAADAIFLQSSAPLYVMLLGPLLLGERTRRRDVAFAIAIALGLLVIVGGAGAAAPTAPAPHLGRSFGAASGLTWGLTLLGLRWLGRTPLAGHGLASVVAGNALAWAAGLALAGGFAEPRVEDVLIVGYLGVVQIGLAYVLLTRGLRRVRAVEASLLLLAEPVFNPIWSWIAHGERPGLATVAGGAVILAATALHIAGQGSGPGLPNR